VYHLSTEGYFLFISDAIVFLGYKPEDLIGKHFSQIIHPDDIPNVSRSAVLPKFIGRVTGDGDSPKLFDERRTAGRMTRGLDLKFLPKGFSINDAESSCIHGKVFACGRVNSTGHYDSERPECFKNFQGTIGIIQNTSQQKRIEEELQKIQRLESLGLLAGGLAHNFNNILTAIISNVSLAKNKIEQSGIVFDSLASAEHASMRAKDLTAQMLSISRGSAPVRDVVLISDVISETCKFCLGGTDTVCRSKFAEDEFPVEADIGQLSQVINNLVINASQAMGGRGIIDITVDNVEFTEKIHSINPGTYVKITVSDHGDGISEKDVRKVFNPYYTTKKGGVGLGLTTSYSIIKNHGGSLSVESKISEGTKFTAFLPATMKNIKKSEKINISTVSLNCRILLIDDEEEILRVTKTLLIDCGFKVDTADSADKAIGLFRERLSSGDPFNMVIMDLIMTGSAGGEEILAELRKIDPSIRSIVTSGYSCDPVLVNYQDHGFNGFIEKPYTIGDLVASIKSAMGV
jgi:two-component system cell cycle sensor histidine kinase/response regulator CckA